MKFGIERFLEDPALRAPLAGRRIALLAHPASVTRDLTHSLDALIAAGDGTAPLHLGSDSRIRLAQPRDGTVSRIVVAPGRAVFVQILDGMARMEGERLVAGDGLQLTSTPPDLHWQSDGRMLIFDMPA